MRLHICDFTCLSVRPSSRVAMSLYLSILDMVVEEKHNRQAYGDGLKNAGAFKRRMQESVEGVYGDTKLMQASSRSKQFVKLPFRPNLNFVLATRNVVKFKPEFVFGIENYSSLNLFLAEYC